MIEPGFYENVPNQAYHAGPGLSRSGISRLLRSPAHFKEQVIEETEAMRFGSAIHAYLFEPEVFRKEFVFTDRHYRSNADKAWKAEQEAAGRLVLKNAEYERIKGMAAAVKACRSAMDLLEGEGEAEICGYWYDPFYPEVLCKLRADWLKKFTNVPAVCVDLKSTKDARQSYFIRSAYNFGYATQVSWYLYGLTQITRVEHKDFYFIAVEKEPPFGVGVYKADEELIHHGLIECNKGVELYSQCMKANSWPCYRDEVKSLGLPSWVKRKADFAIYDGGAF